MKYYYIRTQSDPKIIGVNNGIYQCEIIPENFSNKEAYKNLESIFAWVKYRDSETNLIPDGFEFEYLRLLKKAKITDVISYSPKLVGFQFIISSKSKQLMKGLNLPNCRFLPVQLYDFHGNKVNDTFYMLTATYHGINTVDFKNSVFYSGSEVLGKKYHQIGSYEELLTERENHSLLMAEQISLKQSFADSDFITTPFGGPFLSENLIDRWLEFGVSGFKVANHQRLEVV